MTLHATVYCDCVEKGKLRLPHPLPELLYIDANGRPDIRTDKREEEKLHDDWMMSAPCPHHHFCLVRHYLGSIMLLHSLRQTLAQLSEQPELDFPVLRTQVIHNALQSEDFLAPPQVAQLRDEVALLRPMRPTAPDAEGVEHWFCFLGKLDELITSALALNKPLAF